MFEKSNSFMKMPILLAESPHMSQGNFSKVVLAQRIVQMFGILVLHIHITLDIESKYIFFDL